VSSVIRAVSSSVYGCLDLMTLPLMPMQLNEKLHNSVGAPEPLKIFTPSECHPVGIA
jgi:hypothetical protein